jgi:hypothetical protein
MPSTTAGGWPYIQGSDLPVSYPPVTETLATKLETSMMLVPTVKLRTGTFTAVSDGNGMVTVTPAQLGLSTVTACVASVTWATTYNGTQPQWGNPRISGGVIQILIFSMSASINATIRILTSTSVTVSVLAWGT